MRRGLTIEEVAHVTRLRPEKVIALENDDFSSFPSNAYAKGFLQIYGRYLRVDVTEFVQSLESSNSISIEDYQYLSNAPGPKHSEPVRRERNERRPPSVAPLIFFIVLVFIGLTTTWFVVTYRRTIHTGESGKEEVAGQAPSTQASAPSAVSSNSKSLATPAPAVAPAPLHISTPAPRPMAPATPASTAAVAQNTAAIAPLAVPTPRVSPSALSDRDFVTPTLVPTPDRTAFSSPRSGLNEVLVASVKKTWVTIRKDDPNGTPIFADYLYPNANPLKLKGARFFIDARDPNAVQITKNGLPFAYQAPNVPVQ